MSEEDDKKAYLQQMKAQRGYIRDFHKVLVAEDLPYMKAVNNLLETAYYRERKVDKKTKELVFIGALVGLGLPDKQHLKTHMEAAKRAGATKEEVLELLEMLTTPCGFPKFLYGYDVWTQVYEVQRVEIE
jgi:4-carboxymuconolactone decarboxylase